MDKIIQFPKACFQCGELVYGSKCHCGWVPLPPPLDCINQRPYNEEIDKSPNVIKFPGFAGGVA